VRPPAAATDDSAAGPWTVCRYGAGDEALHDPGGVPLYNESVYFNFVTGLAEGPLGGVLRVGLRPTDGYAELSLHLAMAGGPVRFAYERHPLTTDEHVAGSRVWRCGGMVAECVAPTRRWRVRFAGDGARAVADPVAFGRDPGAALRASPRSSCALELEFDGTRPVHALSPSGDLAPQAGVRYARDHYEQFGVVSGRVEVDGEAWRLDRRPAFRDHSWGPRDWQAAPWMTFASVHLDGGAQLVGIAQRDGGADHAHGVAWTGAALAPLTSMEVRSAYAGTPELHGPLALRFATDGWEAALDAEIAAYLPLRHRSGDRMVRTAQALLRVAGDGHAGWAWVDLTRPAGDGG
jgi:hypothetical protein